MHKHRSAFCEYFTPTEDLLQIEFMPVYLVRRHFRKLLSGHVRSTVFD